MSATGDAGALEEAARVMRERAEAASGGGKWPWKAEPDTMAGRVWVQMSRDRWWKPTDCEPLFSVRGEGYEQREADALHIAAFASPAVALAVSDLLYMAGDHEAGQGRGETCPSCAAKARAVATAYLNGGSP